MPDKAASDKPNSSEVARYRANYLAEQEGAYLYTQLAEIEGDTHLAELYRRSASIEQRHATLWKDYLTTAGQTPPPIARTGVSRRSSGLPAVLEQARYSPPSPQWKRRL